MSEIRWEDPPPITAGLGASGKWLKILAPLVEQPKRWAIIDTASNSEVAAKRVSNFRGCRVKMPPGRWEFMARTVDGEHRVYARYLGPDEDGAA